jgi:hypothetical protein
MSAENLDAARDRLRAQAAASRPTMLTVPEVAEFARCEHKAVRRAIHDGLLPAFETNRRLVIDEADAIAWVKSRPVRTGQSPASRPQRPRSTRNGAEPGSAQALREIQRNLAR